MMKRSRDSAHTLGDRLCLQRRAAFPVIFIFELNKNVRVNRFQNGLSDQCQFAQWEFRSMFSNCNVFLLFFFKLKPAQAKLSDTDTSYKAERTAADKRTVV